MTKQEARYFYLTKRQQLSLQEYNVLNTKIINNFYQKKFSLHNTIMGYLPMIKFNEPNIQDILIPYFNQPFIKIFYPYTAIELNEIIPIQVDKYPFETTENKWGIQEPKILNSNDFLDSNNLFLTYVFVPLIIADKNGHRIGYGKGFYDRFFNRVKSQYRIGVSFFEPIDSIDDINVWDIKLTHCLTPENCYEFK